jgi:hypothetical protein
VSSNGGSSSSSSVGGLVPAAAAPSLHRMEDEGSESTDEYDDDEEDEEDEDDREEKLQKRLHKYPQLSAEILTSDIEKLYDTLVHDNDLLQQLFSFVRSRTMYQNSTLSHYWISVVTALLYRKPVEVRLVPLCDCFMLSGRFFFC